MDVTSIAVLVLLLLVVLLGLLLLRRVRVLRESGVHVALRSRVDDSGRGWHLGIGHYHGDVFEWYRVLGISTRPDRVITRHGLEIAQRREPLLPETYAMPPGASVLRCRSGEVDVELAMGADAMTGFLSWLESAPPGRIPYAS